MTTELSALRSRLLQLLAMNSPGAAAAAVRLQAIWRRNGAPLPKFRHLTSNMREHGRSLISERSPLGDMQPWIPFSARAALTDFFSTPRTVLEFGSGGSTLFWLSLGAKVISIEHDEAWAQVVEQAAYEQIGKHVDLEMRWIEPAPVDDLASEQCWFSSNQAYAGLSFERYVKGAEDLGPRSVDMLFVDGRARGQCLGNNWEKVRPCGLVVVDNSERPEYGWAIDELASRGWRWSHYYGPVPYLRYFSQTSIAVRFPQNA